MGHMKATTNSKVSVLPSGYLKSRKFRPLYISFFNGLGQQQEKLMSEIFLTNIIIYLR